MKKFLGRTLMLIGAWVVVMAIVGTITALMSTESLPEHIVLEVDFEREFAEYVPDDPLASVLMERTASVRDIVDALQQAANDDRVLALVARAGTPRMGLAEIQEVRDAVSAFRKVASRPLPMPRPLANSGLAMARIIWLPPLIAFISNRPGTLVSPA